MRRIALLTTSALLALAGTAQAAGWSAPSTVSAPHQFAQPVELVQSSQVATAVWGWQDGTSFDTRKAGFSSAAAPFGQGFGAESRMSAGVVDLAPNGARRAVAATMTDEPKRHANGLFYYELGVTFGENGRFGSLHRITNAPVVSRPAIGSNGGPLILGWIEISGKREIVKVVTRKPGGSFSKASILSGKGQADVLDVAASRRGDLAIVFVRNGKLLARVKKATSKSWGPIRTLATADGRTQWQPMVAISENGRVVAAWRRYRLRRTDGPGVRSLETAYMSAGKSTFSTPQVIEDDGVIDPRLTVTGASAFVLSWAKQVSAINAAASARVSLSGASGRFGAPIAATGDIGGLRDVRVASLPDVGLHAVWVEPQPGGDGDGIGRGALLAPGATAFGPVGDVTPNENVHEVAIAADAVGKAFVAAWSARPAGTGPGVAVQSLVRAARYTP